MFDKQSQQSFFAEEFAGVVGCLGNSVGEAEQAVAGSQLYSTMLVAAFGKQAEHDAALREPRRPAVAPHEQRRVVPGVGVNEAPARGLEQAVKESDVFAFGEIAAYCAVDLLAQSLWRRCGCRKGLDQRLQVRHDQRG